ncbi:MAG: hypothetical protein WC385_02920 [Candidatus Paceibacterota bacterium]|jgi:hypothetical protein
MIKQYKTFSLIKTLLMVLIFALALPVLAADLPWTAPSTNPPACDPAVDIGCNPPVNVGTSFQVKKAGLGLLDNLSLVAKKVVDFASDLKEGTATGQRQKDAGKIGYQTWSKGLDIVGAGTIAGKRLVQIWDNLTLYGTTTTSNLSVTGTTLLSPNSYICNRGVCTLITMGGTGTNVVANPGSGTIPLTTVTIGTTNYTVGGGTGSGLPAGSATGQTLNYNNSTKTWGVTNLLKSYSDRVDIASSGNSSAVDFESHGNALFDNKLIAQNFWINGSGSFYFPTPNRGAGKVLTSNASGYADWATPASGNLPVGTANGQTLAYVQSGSNYNIGLSNFFRIFEKDTKVVIGSDPGTSPDSTKNFTFYALGGTTLRGPTVLFNSGYIDLGVVGGVSLAPGTSLPAGAKNTISPISSGVVELAIAGSGNTGSRKVSIYDNLNVNGNLNVTGTTTTSGLVVNQICNAAGACSPISNLGGSQWTTSGNNIYYNKTGGNVGIGTKTPKVKLSLGNTITQKKLAIYENADATGSNFFGLGLRSGFLDFLTGDATRMTIGGTGLVGIGNTAPTQLLDIGSATYDGPAYFKAGSKSGRVAGIIWAEGGTDLWSLYKPNDSSQDLRLNNLTSDVLVIKRATGNVGIGKTPTSKLDVNGQINSTGLVVAGITDTQSLRASTSFDAPGIHAETGHGPRVSQVVPVAAQPTTCSAAYRGEIVYVASMTVSGQAIAGSDYLKVCIATVSAQGAITYSWKKLTLQAI